jgi:hypothetical protein
VQTNIKAHSGNRIDVMFDGKKVGGAKSVDLSEDYSPDPVTEIGDIHVLEHVPTVARYSLSVNSLAIRKSTMRKLGITLLDGDDALEGKVFDFLVIDKTTGALLRKYSGCSYASGSTSVTANAIVVSTGQFNALRVSGDEI